MCKSPGSLWRSTRGHVVSIPGLYAFTRPSLSLSFLFSLSLFRRSISSKAGFKLHATSAGSCRCKRNRKEMPRLDNRGTGKHKRGKKYRSTIHHEFRPTFLRFPAKSRGGKGSLREIVLLETSRKRAVNRELFGEFG